MTWPPAWPEEQELPFPGDPFYPRCGCGAFLRRDPERTGYGELNETCTGNPGASVCGKDAVHDSHVVIVMAWTIDHRTCRRCGADCQEVT